MRTVTEIVSRCEVNDRLSAVSSGPHGDRAFGFAYMNVLTKLVTPR